MENFVSDPDLGIAPNNVYELRSHSIPRRMFEQHVQIQLPQDAQPSTLLSVPAEIRLLIFTYLFRTKRVSIRTSRQKTRGHRFILKFFQFKPPAQARSQSSAVLHTCRQLYHEIRPVMLANTTFILNDHYAIFPTVRMQRDHKSFLSSIGFFQVSKESLRAKSLFKTLKLGKMRSLKRLEICMSASITYDLRSYKDWVSKDEKIDDARKAMGEWLRRERSSPDHRKYVDFYSLDCHQSVKDCITDQRRTFTVAILVEFKFETWYKHSEASDEEGIMSATMSFQPGDVEAKVVLGDYKCTKNLKDWGLF